MTLCELYRLPLPESRQFIAFKILAENDFSVMVERKVWIELERVLKPDKLHRILPKHTDYYYSFGHWERYNKLVREIEAVISDEEIKESEKDQFFEELIALRDKFRKELETSFNFRNSLIYERSPFVYGMILRHNYRKHYRTIKEDVQYQIKTRHIGELKVKVNNDLSYALVFVNLYYDLKKALSPESGKRGGQYVPPKEAIADYTLPVNEIVKRLGISHPRYWTVRLLNSFVNTDVYSETLFENETVVTPEYIHNASWDKSRGYKVPGEHKLNRDLQKAKEKLCRPHKQPFPLFKTYQLNFF